MDMNMAVKENIKKAAVGIANTSWIAKDDGLISRLIERRTSSLLQLNRKPLRTFRTLYPRYGLQMLISIEVAVMKRNAQLYKNDMFLRWEKMHLWGWTMLVLVCNFIRRSGGSPNISLGF